jgi:hypothetical protein
MDRKNLTRKEQVAADRTSAATRSHDTDPTTLLRFHFSRLRREATKTVKPLFTPYGLSPHYDPRRKRTMSILKTTAAVLVSGLLIGAAGPTSSASAQQRQQPSTPSAASQTSNSSPAVLPILGMIIPQVEHETRSCNPSQAYSQHDVVGDPQSCFASTVDAPSGAAAAAVVSAP